MNTQHTPGPWLVRQDRNGPSIIHNTGDGLHVIVAAVHETAIRRDEPDHAEHDARLIAAAPELLEALERTLNLFVESHADELMSNHQGDGPDCSYCRQMNAARAAIAKATGQPLNPQPSTINS